jgi:DNA-directed RNA polymerase specialized sigma24 family protein
MSSAGSISCWIDEIKQGDDQAAHALWDRCFPVLVNIARQKLRAIPRTAVDEEDVALSALDNFFRAVAKGRYPDLADREGLWRLLSRITQRKAIDLIRRHFTQKDGQGKVSCETDCNVELDAHGHGVGHFLDEAATEQVAAMLIDDCHQALAGLEDPELQDLALAKMEGYTNEEIAARQKCALRTVERRLQLIRKIWHDKCPQ